MKILLDECVTKRLKPFLSEFDVFTVAEMNWSGTRNGELLYLCVEGGFDIVLTIDKNILHQQNLEKFDISIVVFDSLTSKIEELQLFIPSFKAQMDSFQKHKAYLVGR